MNTIREIPQVYDQLTLHLRLLYKHDPANVSSLVTTTYKQSHEQTKIARFLNNKSEKDKTINYSKSHEFFPAVLSFFTRKEVLLFTTFAPHLELLLRLLGTV